MTLFINVRGIMAVEANGPGGTVLHALVEAERRPEADNSWKVLGPPEFAAKWPSFTVYGPTDDWRPIPDELGPARVIDEREWLVILKVAAVLSPGELRRIERMAQPYLTRERMGDYSHRRDSLGEGIHRILTEGVAAELERLDAEFHPRRRPTRED